MIPLISVIIPNYNGAATLGHCLRAATSLSDEALELIVVDDGSNDDSVEIIKRFPCTLIPLGQHSGASHARNTGAKHSHGEILFFTDADCLLQEGTLSRVRRGLSAVSPNVVLGGTYTPQPYDDSFFSRFQSVFIHYSETKNLLQPDYVATHAMAIKAGTFRDSGGFAEDMGPILEDVEYSHRLRRSGIGLNMDPSLQVQHIFNFSLLKSLRNAVRKTRHWALYSLKNRDLFADSGTASLELKFNVVTFFFCVLMLVLAFALGMSNLFVGVALLMGANVVLNRRLIKTFYTANGPLFALGAALYYLGVYPLAVGVGAIAGAIDFLRLGRSRRKS
ncbi:MAG: glycosyltransferase [Halobacteria archaeon]|nr:glycosyltransferase [Halobacteria archaeon]